MWSVILPVGVLLFVSGKAFMPYPWHASCEIKWNISASCEDFKTKLINQMKSWEGDSLCPKTSPSCPKMPCGQRCLYKFGEYDDMTITGTHQTPANRYAVLDFGTNYCNLRNLVDG